MRNPFHAFVTILRDNKFANNYLHVKLKQPYIYWMLKRGAFNMGFVDKWPSKKFLLGWAGRVVGPLLRGP